jgi:SLT domain-containing protein
VQGGLRYEEKLESVSELEVCPKCGRLGKRYIVAGEDGRPVIVYAHAYIRIKGKLYKDECKIGPVEYVGGSPRLLRELGVTTNVLDNPQYDLMIENLLSRLIERMLSDKTPPGLRGELRRQAENLLQALPSIRSTLEQAVADHDAKYGVLKQRRVLRESEYLERKMNEELLKKLTKKRKV